MASYTGNSSKIYEISSKPFAGGGEGDIYDILDEAALVAKIYKNDKRSTERERKLLAMLEVRPDSGQYAWPMDILYENGSFAGYVMPKVTGKKKLRSIYAYDNRKGQPWPLYTAIAKNLAAAIHNLHETGQVIGDLNPENILVDPNTGLVTLVDTDSYHITDANGSVYRCMVGMPEFVAPELHGLNFPSAPLPTFTRETDLFSLGELIFALLMNGAHPFACKTISGSCSSFQPIDNMVKGICAYFPESSTANLSIPLYSPSLESLPHDISELFRRTLILGHRDREIRTSAGEWFYALKELEENISRCTTNKEHLYYNKAPYCPWCKIEKEMGSIVQETFDNKGVNGTQGQKEGKQKKPGAKETVKKEAAQTGTKTRVPGEKASSTKSIKNKAPQQESKKASGVTWGITAIAIIALLVWYRFSLYEATQNIRSIQNIRTSQNVSANETVIQQDFTIEEMLIGEREADGSFKSSHDNIFYGNYIRNLSVQARFSTPNNRRTGAKTFHIKIIDPDGNLFPDPPGVLGRDFSFHYFGPISVLSPMILGSNRSLFAFKNGVWRIEIWDVTGGPARMVQGGYDLIAQKTFEVREPNYERVSSSTGAGNVRFINMPTGARVYENPSLSSNVKFSLAPNTRVTVFVQNSTEDWARIRYNDSEGYVQQTDLRNFMIEQIMVGNVNNNMAWINYPGNTLNASDIDNILIQAKIIAMGNVNIDYEVRLTGPLSPFGISTMPVLRYTGRTNTDQDSIINAATFSVSEVRDSWGMVRRFIGGWYIIDILTRTENSSDFNNRIASEKFYLH